ncbi:uncharacterized protein DUF3108 [Aminobacter aminovorans]|uniref:Protein of uncharacterized function (DUF3108) n=1 Tax=Aminobacter aminovorans TaxID=83263 RepID=A0A380WHA3_AMIAI|nr:DUF3108 domain-containing protein [Aminobacter aminovorans]TCS26641.1 uncharacterized protein DUF3108 [Aminobacter aminovorans]SUU88300.1 Protein of uncharacterised function (DUF3108) [Aminobacter aminovorans]
MPRLLPVLLAVSLALLPSPLLAAGKSFSGDYSLSFLGIPVAKATFDSSYEGNSYVVKGKVSSAGLAAFFDDTRGTISSRGSFGDGRTKPRAFRADYVSGKVSSLVAVGFSGDRVVSTEVVPAPRKRGKTWIPLGANDLRGVADPIAATVIRAPSLDKVCGRTVKIYDGELRADLRLTEVSRKTMSVKGFAGETVTCRMGFQPVSGYRTDKKALTFLRDRSRIMVTFAPLGKTGIYAPIYATVSTQIGTITVKARRFEAID